MEAAAEARRRLPPGGVVPQDYLFQAQAPGGRPARVRLSELFAPGKNSLVIYSMMFPRAPDDTSPGPPGGQTALLPLAEGPCLSCTALLDQLDGAAEYLCQHVNLAVATKAPLERILTFAAEGDKIDFLRRQVEHHLLTVAPAAMNATACRGESTRNTAAR